MGSWRDRKQRESAGFRPRKACCGRSRWRSSARPSGRDGRAMIFDNLREFGYAGRVHLINPRQSEVFGERCFPSLRDLPEPVDHAMVIVPAPASPDVLTDAEAAGVKSATVYAAAVGDGEDPASREARRLARRTFVATSKLRVGGPNCMGALQLSRASCSPIRTRSCAASRQARSAACSSPAARCSSGCKTAADRGLRFSYGISSGNEADLDLADYLNFLVDDPHTRQIVLFIEGIRRPEAFMRAAGRALAAGKPILAIKTGATQSRERRRSRIPAPSAATTRPIWRCASATASVNCRSLDDMLETALAFQCGRLPKGPRIGFVTTSGGTVDLLYDYAESRRRGDSGIFRRHQRGAAALHAGRHRAEESARRRHSDDAQGRRRPAARSWRAIPTSTWWPGPSTLPARAAPGTTSTNCSACCARPTSR